MLALSSAVRYFMYHEPTDMRFGINSLAGLVRNRLGFDPMNGDVFVFLGKRSNQIRFLQWDRDACLPVGRGLPCTSKSWNRVLLNVLRCRETRSRAVNSACFYRG